jgi:A/G-specific adenine glycosylase
VDTQLLPWFHRNKRALPWRTAQRDPYHVWLSEVMLQQTQVATVIPYFERWLQRFPTLADFAAAPLDEVLKAWEGLGYYSRARNFHKAAQLVVREHAGRVPDTVDGLLALPGVGRYTAGAIASLAFGRHAAVLDGNVKRVLSRYFAVGVASPESRIPTHDARKSGPATRDSRLLWSLAESLLPPGQAGEFNEALMELGATVCTARAPKCGECPLRAACKALAEGNPEHYPLKTTKPPTPHHYVLTAVITHADGRVLLGQRPPEGLLGGLWEFVSSEFRAPAPPASVADMVRERTRLRITGEPEALGAVKHAFTHFKITRHLYRVRAASGEPAPIGYAALRWLPLVQVAHLALTRSDQKVLGMAMRR